MSLAIPENMEEVMMRQAMLKSHGQEVTVDEIIQQSVLDVLQAFVDQDLDGHYDEVKWVQKQLVIYDLSHDETARIAPRTETFVMDFKTNSQAVLLQLEDAAKKAVGSR